MTSLDLPPIPQVLAVAIGGSVGSVVRFLTGYYFATWYGTSFPWATLFVNVAGSLWLGFIATLAIQKPGAIDPVLRLALTAGFAGGFTTFSTFAFETLSLYDRGDNTLALANMALNLIVGIASVWLGIILARLL
jgi:CrcB protein